MMKEASFVIFQKPTFGQNVRIKIFEIDRKKMDPKSITNTIPVIEKD